MLDYELPTNKPEKDTNEFETYKLVYEQATTRYDNIYKAVWQNFSYMALLSGAMLTFGKDTLGMVKSGFFACLPLLFWYWATFEPLNRYGTRVGKRLSEIEKSLSSRPLSPKISHFSDFLQASEDKKLSDILKEILGSCLLLTASIVCIVTTGIMLTSLICYSSYPAKATVCLVALSCAFVVTVVFACPLLQWAGEWVRARYTVRLAAALLHAVAFILIVVVGMRLFNMPISFRNPSVPEKTDIAAKIRELDTLVTKQAQLNAELEKTKKQLNETRTLLETFQGLFR